MTKLPHVIRLGGPWSVLDAGRSVSLGTMDSSVVMGLEQKEWPEILEVRRPFGWVAKVSPEEQVVLVLDDTCHYQQVQLNGSVLSARDDVLQPRRFDVTRLLKPRNEVAILIRTPQVRNSPAMPTIFREPPRLSIESVRGRIKEVRFKLHEPDAKESVVLLVGTEVSAGLSEGLELRVDLGGASVLTQSVPSSAGNHYQRLAFPPVCLEPWRPRGFGIPVRHELRLQLVDGDRILHERGWMVGLRDIDFLGDSDDAVRIRCGGRELRIQRSRCSVEQAYARNFGYPQGMAIEQWDLVQGSVLDLGGLFGPDVMFETLDRIGLFWLGRKGMDLASDRLIEQLSHHPSLLIAEKSGARGC